MKKIIFTAVFIACLSLVISAQNGSKQIGKANEMLSKGNINGAIAALNKAVENNEGSFEVYKMRSSLYGMTGNLQGEFDDLSKAIELHPPTANFIKDALKRVCFCATILH